MTPVYYRVKFTVFPFHFHCVGYIIYVYMQIMLAFSNGNHYDSVYSTQHIRNTAFCQGKYTLYSGQLLKLKIIILCLFSCTGIVYETLFLRVFKDTMPPPCKQRLASLQDSDVEQIRMHQEASHYDRPFIERPVHLLSTHYMIEEIESMAANIYRNTAMDVHQREKASEYSYKLAMGHPH